MVLLTHSALGHRRVAVDHHRPAAVLVRPRVAHRQAELVGLAGGLAVQRERRAPARTRGRGSASLEPGVRDDEPAAVEHVVADQAVEERARPRPGTPRSRRSSCASDSASPWVTVHVAAAQRAQQLVLVVARHAQRVPGRDHAHHQAQHARGVRAAVDQVADEHRRAGRRGGARRPAGPRRRGRARSRARSSSASQLGAAAVHVADDVERAGQVARSFHSGSRDDRRRASTSSAPRSTWTRAEALPLAAAAATRRSCRAAGGGRRARRSRGRAAPRCARRQTRSGTSSTIATGSTSCSRASCDQRPRGPRAARWSRRRR